MRWNKTKLEIYQYLIGTHPSGDGKQFCPVSIARFLGLSRSYVSRIAREFYKEGYIIRHGKHTKPVFYDASKKKPDAEFTTFAKKVTTPTPRDVNQITTPSRQGMFTTSKSRWSCPIKHLPSNIKAWKKVELKNGVIQFYKKIIFDKPIDDVILFQIIGKYNYTMTLTFPHFSFDSIEHFRQSRDIVKDFAVMAFRYMSQRFKIPLRLNLVRYSSGDFEHPLRDVDIKNFIDTATVTIDFKNGFKYVGKLDFDGSGRVDKIESDIPSWVADYSEIPFFSKRLQSLEKSFESSFDSYFSKVNKMIEKTVSEKLDDMFRYKPSKKDDVRGFE